MPKPDIVPVYTKKGGRVLRVLIQAEYTTRMNKVVCPWVSRKAFTPEQDRQIKR